jgi:hypothetical protein
VSGMARREFVALLGGVVVACPMTTRAQQPERMRRIGALMDTDESNAEGQARIAAFRQGLQQLGWTEDRNIQIDLRWGGGNVERTRGFATELVHLSPDVIFAYALLFAPHKKRRPRATETSLAPCRLPNRKSRAGSTSSAPFVG